MRGSAAHLAARSLLVLGRRGARRRRAARGRAPPGRARRGLDQGDGDRRRADQGHDARQSQFEQAELDAAVAEARALGRHVAAHCHGTEGIGRAARAGVRTIEHCSFASEEGFGTAPDASVIADVARSGAWVSPTVNTGFARFFAEDGEPRQVRDAHEPGLHAAATARARRSSPRPTRAFPSIAHHRLPEALPIFARLAELRPVEALRTATSEAARALGLEHETGRLVPGLAADVLVVDGNPLEDLAALLRPVLVVARGRIVRR